MCEAKLNDKHASQLPSVGVGATNSKTLVVSNLKKQLSVIEKIELYILSVNSPSMTTLEGL